MVIKDKDGSGQTSCTCTDIVWTVDADWFFARRFYEDLMWGCVVCPSRFQGVQKKMIVPGRLNSQISAPVNARNDTRY